LPARALFDCPSEERKKTRKATTATTINATSHGHRRCLFTVLEAEKRPSAGSAWS
jgi:hypothetical protein